MLKTTQPSTQHIKQINTHDNNNARIQSKRTRKNTHKSKPMVSQHTNMQQMRIPKQKNQKPKHKTMDMPTMPHHT